MIYPVYNLQYKIKGILLYINKTQKQWFPMCQADCPVFVIFEDIYYFSNTVNFTICIMHP
jgi:hypothetical protein